MIIPARNAAETIGRAVRSALDQPEAAEVIVVDDGSADETAAVARAAGADDPRLTVHSLGAWAGPSAARNAALRLSRAEWVTPLDADDYLLPGRFTRMLPAADDCDILADDLLMVDQGRTPDQAQRLFAGRWSLPHRLTLAEFALGNISRRRFARRELGFVQPLIRRAFLQERRLAYQEDLRLGEDYVLYAWALAHGARFKLIEAQGYVAVQRPGSLSSVHDAEDLRALAAACEQLAAFPGLSPADRAGARRHLVHVRRKLRLREFLDAKNRVGLARASAWVARWPQDLPYIFGTLAADRLNRRLPTRAG